MEDRAHSADVEVAKLLISLARRADAPPIQDPEIAAAWDGIAEACQQIADHARFMREKAGGVRWRRRA